MGVREYLSLLEQFVKTGEVFDFVTLRDPVSARKSPILVYLHKLMNDPMTQAKVLSSRLAGKVFYETVGKFVVDCHHQEVFSRQCAMSEYSEMDKMMEWSADKKEDKRSWQTLMMKVSEEHRDDGFDLNYLQRQFQRQGWDNPESHELLKREWTAALEQQSVKKIRQKIETQEQGISEKFDRVLRDVKSAGSRSASTEEQMLQAWEMMDGNWVESEFEKHLSLVQIENKYPEIGEVVRRMGRLPDEEGRDKIAVQTGTTHKLDHSAGSDIEGVTIGNNLGAMMPLERAQSADKALESLFIRKYLTNRLQIFRYRSEISKPARRLRTEGAVRRGPMIVCVDSSASMYGVPQRIEASLLSKLEQTAEQLERDCFLIDFSVGIRPIELRTRRKNNALRRMGIRIDDQENFAKGYFPFLGGGTDAEKMLRLTFHLLDNGGDKYMNADVLWITDFLIPRTSGELMRQFKDYQQTGTRFYGFKIGGEDSGWSQYFDQVFEVRYKQPRRF